MTLVALRHQVDHHEPPLSDGEVETGGLADDSGIDLSSRLDGGTHGGVLGLLAVAQNDQQASSIHAARVHQVLGGVEHRRDRGLGIARPAPVQPGSLDDRM